MAKKRGMRAEVAAKWRERLDRWQRRPGSISEFCRREGISQASFFMWRKRLALGKSRRPAAVAPRGAAFIPVQVIADSHLVPTGDSARAGVPDHHASLEIALGKLVCRVPSQLDELTLRRVVRVLCEEAARC